MIFKMFPIFQESAKMLQNGGLFLPVPKNPFFSKSSQTDQKLKIEPKDENEDRVDDLKKLKSDMEECLKKKEGERSFKIERPSSISPCKNLI